MELFYLTRAREEDFANIGAVAWIMVVLSDETKCTGFFLTRARKEELANNGADASVLSDEAKCTGVLSDQSKKRRTFEIAGCAKKSTVARGSSQDFVAMSFIAVLSHRRGI